MERIQNVAQILIATTIDTYSATNTPDDLAVGQLGVFGLNNLQLNGVPSSGKFKFCVKNVDGTITHSDVIDVSTYNYTVNVHSAATAQLDYIGYNGTSGAIDVINSNIYTIRLYLKDNTTASFMRDLIKEGYYKSDSSATQTEIALGLIHSLNANFKRDAECKDLVRFDLINSAAVDVDNDFTGIATVVQGSKYMTVAAVNTTTLDGGSYDTGTNIAVGDFVRIRRDGPSAVVGSTTAVTDSVYRVEAVSGVDTLEATVTLDREVNEASGSYNPEGTTTTNRLDIEVIPAASIGNFGIRMQAKAKTFIPGVFNSEPYVRWDTNIQDFGSTTITKSTGSSWGIGDYRWVAEREYEWQMNEYMYRAAQPQLHVYRSDALYHQSAGTVSTGYDVTIITFRDNMTSDLGGSVASLKQLYLATDPDINATLDTLLVA